MNEIAFYLGWVIIILFELVIGLGVLALFSIYVFKYTSKPLYNLILNAKDIANCTDERFEEWIGEIRAYRRRNKRTNQ